MFGLAWLSPTLLGALGIALIASLSGGYIAHRLDAGPLATAKAETATLQAKYSAYEASVAANAAKANADALAQQTALQSRANDLQNQLIQTQKAADARSKTLQALLAAAKPGDVREIGPVAGAYYSQLRGSQAPGRTAHPDN